MKYIHLRGIILTLLVNRKIMNSLNLYRIKFDYYVEDAKNIPLPKKEETLVQAMNYTDAEAVALKLQENMRSVRPEVRYEILKTRISDLIYTNVLSVDPDLKQGLITYYFDQEEESAGLFAVTVIYTETLDNGRIRKTKEEIYVAAENPGNALGYVNSYLKYIGETRDWVTRNVKFEKVSSILVSPETYKKDLKIVQDALF